MWQIAISCLISLGMILGAQNYTEQHGAIKFGANSTISALTALTSPAYDDVIAIVDSSPTPTTKKMTWAVATSSIKTDFDAIYAPKIGSTNITTLGTVTTGTWNASILSAQYGGTGSSTLSSNLLFVGNGTGAVRSIASGNAGQYLISNGAGVAPTFQTASVDQAGTYTWTGVHTHTATTTLATTTILGKDATPKFGGDGRDGALNITSGTTTIDVGAQKYFVKNYSSINISVGAALAFSNPNTTGTIVVLKSGSTTIGGRIDLAGVGATAGNNGVGQIRLTSLISAGAAFTYNNTIYGKFIDAVPGAGASAGGVGGGALIFEISGAYNFPSTGIISSVGGAGSAGNAASTFTPCTGGAGGSSGGSLTVIYASSSLIANLGQYLTNGGAGGAGGSGSDGGSGGGSGVGGASGSSHQAVGGAGGAGKAAGGGAGGAGTAGGGSNGGAGGAGGAAGTFWGACGGGGGGSGGYSVVVPNTEF